MNFFDFQEKLYSGEAVVLDDNLTDAGRANQVKAPHGEDPSARAIAEFSHKDKILSAEELLEHRKHCRAKPGNCPFEKAVDEADEITPNEIKVSKQNVYNRLAAVLTQLFQVAKNLAKPAIAEPEVVEELANPSEPPKSKTNASDEKKTEDEAPSSSATPMDEPNSDAKIVAEIIEGGIEKMVELAKGKGCLVDMDDKNTKYIVSGPQKD